MLEQVIHSSEIRRRLPEALEIIQSNCPNIRALVCPKDYKVPEGYSDPSVSMISAYAGVRAIFDSRIKGYDETIQSVHVVSSMLIRYQMPTWFVSGNLCEALLATEAPKDLRFDEIQFPMPAMRFMLPYFFAMDYFGFEVPYLLIAAVPPGEPFASPIKMGDIKCPVVHCANAKTIFVCSMLSWEQGSGPMHYDARSPVDNQVSELMSDKPITEWSAHRPISAEEIEKDTQTVKKMTNLAVNILLAMTAEPELVTREHVIREAKKKDGNILRRALWKPNFIGERFKVEYEHGEPQGTHRSPHVHWRVGHWRNQRHGPKNTLIKRIWIRPVLVGLPEIHA